MTMTPKEAISYIENYGWSTTRLGLGRTKELLSLLGDPQKKLKFVHVAGSNGKGSTCAMLASILKEAGYRTGLYISPYIQEFGERIQINGVNIEGERLAEITERVKLLADSMKDHPSQFELVTAIAIQYYFEENCDIVVLEVGMGGALDSTNAIDAPEVAVITNIGLEHTEYLGNTLEEIAETKGGIIKTGANCVCYQGEPEVTDVIKRICGERNVPLKVVDFSKVTPEGFDLDGQRFKWKGRGEEDEKKYFIPLLGPHQLNNGAMVLETVEALRTRGWKIPEEAIKSGLEKVKWPARFEVLTKKPLFILDGGHNPQCAEALKETIEIYLPNDRIVFLLGVLADKDYESIIEMMEPYAREFVCVTPLSDRALAGDKLAEVIRSRGGIAQSADSISDGIDLALEKSGDNPIIAFGSLYLAGAVRTQFHREYKAWMRREGKKARQSLPLNEWLEKSNKVSALIVNTEEYRNANTIFIYQSAKGEVSLEGLASQAKLDGKTVCFPRWGAEDMEAVEYSPKEKSFFDESSPAKADFWQPDPEEGVVVEPEDIDLVICPLVGFDEECFRLGLGGGYYDRFLPRCTKAVKYGAAFENQKFERVPRDTWDIPLDAVVTEKGIYRR